MSSASKKFKGGTKKDFAVAETVADLKKLTNMRIGATVILEGYYSAGDGGGGTFEIQSSGTGDDGITFAMDDGLYAVRLYSGAINLLWFGAEGDWDGSTGRDNTSALQAAMDTLPDKGGVIYIPGGTYKFESTVTFPLYDASNVKPITIIGDNGQNQKGAVTSYNEGETTLYYSGTGNFFDLRNGDDSNTQALISLKNFSVYGADTAATYFLYGYDAKGAQFENLMVSDFDYGMYFDHYIYYSIFDHVRIFSCVSNGLTYGLSNGTIFNRCNFSQCDIGIRGDYSGSANGIIGCWFESNRVGAHISNSSQASFYGCYFEDNSDYAVIAADYEVTSHTHFLFSGCYMELEASGGKGILAQNVTITLQAMTVLSQGAESFLVTAAAATNPVVYSYGFAEITSGNAIEPASGNLLQVDSGNYAKAYQDFQNMPLRFSNGADLELAHALKVKAGVGNGDVASVLDLDFSEIATVSGKFRFFRNTTTTGDPLLEIWDGAGALGAVINGRTGKVLAYGGIGVGNSAAATTPGSVTNKMEVFDENGASLGFVPIYDAIT